jgi:hypothetical protein
MTMPTDGALPDAHRERLLVLAESARTLVEDQDDPAKVLAALALMARSVDRAQRQTVYRMLCAGYSWIEIGRCLGVSRQAATQRFGTRS